MKHRIVAFLLIFLIPTYLQAQKTATLIYIDQYKDIAIKEMKRTGIPASITLAQGILESNSGQSNLAYNFKNHFGIKCKSDWHGETTYQDDDAKQECFRVYPTAVRSYIDHSDFLKSRPNYANLFELDPVDDSAWAYGLKKAGYATAPDYPKKLLKVIDDFELSQYNFPELAKEDSIEAPTTTNTNTNTTITPTITKDTLGKIKMDSVVALPDSVSLNNVKGLSVTQVVSNSVPMAPQSIELIKPELKKDTPAIIVSLNKVVKINVPNYPSVRFKINDIPVVWAKAGSSYLSIANSNMVPLYRLFEYNEIQETNLLATDQLVFLAAKKKGTNKKVHTIKANETLYDISQSEGIQLEFLKLYNPKAADNNLKEGDFLFLFSPYDAPKKSSSFLEAFKPLFNKNSNESENTISTPVPKLGSAPKEKASIFKNRTALKSKIDLIKKWNPFNKK